MKIEQWLAEATKKLAGSDIATARLDAEVLLADALAKDRAWLLTYPDHVLQDRVVEKLNSRIERRANYEPLAYIRGQSEFYGRNFLVTPATLQPRPETETMIELLKTMPITPHAIAADIGTGSGAIAITAKLELPHLVVHGTDIQADALEIAHKNRDKLSAEVAFHKGNLLEPLMNTLLDIILANLPYVPDGHPINRAAMQEPSAAIFGGEDGLDLYREMFAQLSTYDLKPSAILTESLPFQHGTLETIAESAGYKLEQTEDFIQLFSRSVKG